MTIKQIADKIIREIKAFPEEAKQSQSEGGPKTSWDEYKEQIQHCEYDSFEVFEETIQTMVEDVIEEFTVDEIDSCIYAYYSYNREITLDEKSRDIFRLVMEEIQDRALNEVIHYKKPYLKYIRYYEDDLIIYGKVLKQVDPSDFLIHIYSEETGPDGEQLEEDLNILDGLNGLESISRGEFQKEVHKLKRSL